MPSIKSRTTERNTSIEFTLAPNPGSVTETPLSPVGNPAPTRGTPPFEFMYDFQVGRLYPENFRFQRGLFNINFILQNLALQALTKKA